MVWASSCQHHLEKRPWTSALGVTAKVLATALVLSGPRVPVHAAPYDGPQGSATGATFQTDILPIFERNCLRCHDAKVKKGGLDLSTSEAVLAGGESGQTVVPKQPAASKLYDMVDNGKMPLDRKTQVSTSEKATIRLWIE